MAFRRKWPFLIQYRPDILVIQECEHPSKYQSPEIIKSANEFIWYGDNSNKGLGILSFGPYHIELDDQCHDPRCRYIVPIKITSPIDILIYAIWAMDDTRRSRSYVGQICYALEIYPRLEDTIWIGDFNSNAIWDKKRKHGNHSDVVELLSSKGLVSTYHELMSEEHGKESKPTIYLLKNINKPYHLDYCFVPAHMISSKTSVIVGDKHEWLHLSDHMPLIINDLTIGLDDDIFDES